jgi:multicomponent Na+:H+ antiporter subunit C
MLTDIVVEVTVVALLLAIAVQIQKRHGTLDPNRLKKVAG